MPFGFDPRPELVCQQCGHKERIGPTHAATALKNGGNVRHEGCGGTMWMPGFGPAHESAAAAPAVALETAFVRRGESGFGIVMDDAGTVVGGAGHTCEAIPVGASVVRVNTVDVFSKAEIVAVIKDVAQSGQAEFTYRPLASAAPSPAATAEAEADAAAEAAAAATAAKLAQLDDSFAIGALTEEQFLAAKLRLIEPPGVGAEPSPREPPAVSPSATLEPEPEPDPVNFDLAAVGGGGAEPEPEPEPEPTAVEDELTPRTEADLATKYLGANYASEAEAAFVPEPSPAPAAGGDRAAAARSSASGVLGGLGGLASTVSSGIGNTITQVGETDLDPRPLLQCSNATCGNTERAKVLRIAIYMPTFFLLFLLKMQK